jgi:hypothetical protein
MHTIDDYTDRIGGVFETPILCQKGILQASCFTEYSGGETYNVYFKFQAIAGKKYTIGIESGETLSNFLFLNIEMAIWKPSDIGEASTYFSNNDDVSPPILPYDYVLTGGARIQFIAEETGEYVIAIFGFIEGGPK